VPIEETLDAFGELVSSGKVRYIGLSNYPTSNMREALAAATDGRPRFVSLQPHYNLVWREEYESRKAAFCRDEGIAAIPYSPLEAGFLSGKYRRGQPLPKSQRAGGVRRFMTDDGFNVVEALDAVAANHGVAPSAVALAWLLSKDTIAAPIIGANTTEQLADLLPAAELALDPAEVASLDAASEPFTRST
jgi:aryl-alcohol dehydrogenase-like predicted oxidoreductase